MSFLEVEVFCAVILAIFLTIFSVLGGIMFISHTSFVEHIDFPITLSSVAAELIIAILVTFVIGVYEKLGKDHPFAAFIICKLTCLFVVVGVTINCTYIINGVDGASSSPFMWCVVATGVILTYIAFRGEQISRWFLAGGATCLLLLFVAQALIATAGWPR
jgi:hypothetical protein